MPVTLKTELQVQWKDNIPVINNKGVRKGGGLTLPLSLIFYKNFITFERRLIVFAYFLLVNLSA